MQSLYTLTKFLITSDILRMPPYQRQYSWEQPELSDLWNDLLYLEKEKRYYFGQILLKKTKNKESSLFSTYNVFEIIDGQQRIASTLILLRCILNELRSTLGSDSEKAALEHFEKNYLKAGNFPKLSLLGGDEAMFNAIIFGENELPEPKTDSQKRLLAARNFFAECLREEKEVRESDFNALLTELKDKLLSFEIIEYIVDNEAEAALMFETVNDRGRPLKTLEKIKSLLMYMVYLSSKQRETGSASSDGNQELLSQINDSFGAIFVSIGAMSENLRRGRKLDEDSVQRIHFAVLETGSPYSYDTISVMKPKLTEMYKSKKRQELLDYVSIYSSSIAATFDALSEVLLNDSDSRIGEHLDRLFLLRSHEFSLPLILSSWMKLTQQDSDDLCRLFRFLEILLFRVYSLHVRTRSRVSEQLYRLAHEFYLDHINLDSILSSLRYLAKHYAADDFFRADIEDRQFYYNAKNATKLIFFEYERELRRKNREAFDVTIKDWLTDKFQIDHVWAQTAPVYGADLEEYLNVGHKLGNLIVIPAELNQSLGNVDFSLKRQHFAKHWLRSLKEVGGARIWREQEINSRTTHIREFVMTRWQIPAN